MSFCSTSYCVKSDTDRLNGGDWCEQSLGVKSEPKVISVEDCYSQATLLPGCDLTNDTLTHVYTVTPTGQQSFICYDCNFETTDEIAYLGHTLDNH